MKSMSRDALDKIMEYDWPGNVRELENTLECAIVLNTFGQISADSIKFFKNTDNQITVYREAKLEFEFKFLKELMERTRGNISKAARMSDIYRSDLYELLKKHDIDPKEYR
jgi:two-component system response regulator GlrR